MARDSVKEREDLEALSDELDVLSLLPPEMKEQLDAGFLYKVPTATTTHVSEAGITERLRFHERRQTEMLRFLERRQTKILRCLERRQERELKHTESCKRLDVRRDLTIVAATVVMLVVVILTGSKDPIPLTIIPGLLGALGLTRYIESKKRNQPRR